MWTRLRVLLCACAFSLPVIAPAQSVERWEVPFSRGGEIIPQALLGGLNAPQFSTVHLDEDGQVDLLVYDRGAGKFLPFIRVGERPGDLRYAPELEDAFPRVDSWCLAMDFDGDSITDLFTFSDTGVPGIDVYRGLRSEGEIGFAKMSFDNNVGVLGYPTSGGAIANIYVSAIDLPAITDFDGDGDMDILSFQSDGSRMHYYRNLVVEKDLPSDTLDFILEDRCWGKVLERFTTNDVILSDDPGVCPEEFQIGRAHSGSTVTAFDEDGDGDMEILLGDLSFDNMVYLHNGGTVQQAFVTGTSSHFPEYDRPVQIMFFPAAFVQDLDMDGVPDLIASPNQKDARENVRVAWRYQGQMDGAALQFTLIEDDYLTADMLDLGTDAAPLFMDYNGDELLDLVVGSRFHQDYDEDVPSLLFLFENTGSAEAPAFDLVNANWLDVAQYTDEIDMLHPSCADTDGDGDQDLLVGNKRGKILHIENVAVPGAAFEAGQATYPWFGIDVGFSSSPCMVDVDGDGRLDLLIGEEKGNVNLFTNLGSINEPLFDPDINAPGNQEEFGQIDARQDKAVFGSATPVHITTNDTSLLLVGSTFGNFLLYDLSASDGTDTLPSQQHAVGEIFDGGRSKATLHDIDGDGFAEMMTGNSRGGLTLYRTPFLSDQSVPTREIEQDPWVIQLFPNPAIAEIQLHASSPMTDVVMYDHLGQRIFQWAGRQMQLRIDIEHLAPGVYHAHVQGAGERRLLSWLKL